jgi:glutamate synthase (NADPH) small chain
LTLTSNLVGNVSLSKISLEKRKATFDEVNIGFTKEQAIAEANRCLQCKEPKCVQGCPANVLIPDFIKAFRDGDIEKAAKIIRLKNMFPSICGRICQHEKQCEGNCILAPTGKAIAIGGIERYIGDNVPYPKKKKTNGKKIAIIGSGPSGLTVASNLALKGFNVTVFERTHALGGIIKYGVPEFRLPKAVVAKELRALHDLGIDFEPDAKISDEYIKKIAKEFDAVFLGTGVGFARKLQVEGSQLKGIIPAMKFLVHLNQSDMPLINENDNVVVVGAGYVGIDAARSAVRLGAKKVKCITVANRADAERGVSKKDYMEAEEEGVEFLFGLIVTKFESKDGEKVSFVYYQNGENGTIKADKVIVAIGQVHDEEDFKQPLRDKKNGMVKVNNNHKTRMKNVFAAGDCVHGPKTVIEAIARGRDAAKEICDFLELKENQ